MIDYNAMTEAERINEVGKNGHFIRYIKNPSEAVCIEAVKISGSVIQFIENPSEAVQMAAVSIQDQRAYVLKHIKSPSEVVQHELRSFSPQNEDRVFGAHAEIALLPGKNAGLRLQLGMMAAVRQDGWVIRYIKTPTEAICMAAVNQNGNAIRFIDNPSEAVCTTAVKSDAFTLRFMPKPVSDTVVTTLLVHHPLSPHVPKEILDRAPEFLENYCSGLGDVYIIGLSMNMVENEISRTMIEWIESHSSIGVAVGAEMSP